MESFSVLWIDSAKDDLFSIIDYIALGNESNARKIYSKIKAKVASLSSFPLKGRIVPEFEEFHINLYREIVESPWRIIYHIQGSNVIILAIIDGRRDIEDILFEKILK